MLAASSAREGAIEAFGDRATRPVVRALVHALLPDASGQVGLTSLALALIGRDVLPPDRLARVLRAERLPTPLDHLPDPATLDQARRVAAGWGAVRAERVLTDAAGLPDGLALLLATIRWSAQLRGHGPARLPNRLQELHDVHRARIATAPPPRPAAPTPTRPQRPARRTAAPVERPEPRRIVLLPDPEPAPPRHPILAPPAVPIAARATVTADGELPVPATVRALDGQQVEGLTFVVPRTGADLVRWGRVLSNCLGSFDQAVAAGQSTIIGVEHAGRLAYALELTTQGTIRQFHGAANRPPDPRPRDTVVRALLRAGLLAADYPRNQRWLAAPR